MNSAHIGTPRGTNLITDEEGRTYHVGVKKGEVANRIILVGEESRASRVSKFLSNVRQVGTTHRGFFTLTGEFDASSITIMSIGMGCPMMDFAVREIAQVTTGDLSIIRLGTCGTINSNVSLGNISVAERSVFVHTNYNQFSSDVALPYQISSRVLSASPMLTSRIKSELGQQVPVIFGTDITSDSFYSSQGRHDPQFEDRNKLLIDTLRTQIPDASSMQMETYQLLHLADIIRGRTIHAAAIAIVVAQRCSEDFLAPDRKHELEQICGLAALKALSH